MGKIHIAILKKKYADLILTGEKQIESRITKNNCAPFDKITVGDKIYLKISSGPFVGMTTATKIEQYSPLSPHQIMDLYQRLDDKVCGGQAYWEAKQSCHYATFVWLGPIEPVDHEPRYTKSMKAWHVLQLSVEENNTPCDSDVISRLETLNRGSTIEPPSPDVPETAASPHCPYDWTVKLTHGALQNGYIRVPNHTSKPLQEPLRLIMPDSQEIVTEILPERHMIRWRGWPNAFKHHQMAIGDEVRFVSLGGGRYRVLFVKAQRNSRQS